MNKAFVKEPEPEEPRCPGCQSRGSAVGARTLAAQLDDALARRLSGSAYYCPAPSCAVGYYDAWGGQVEAAGLRVHTFPKDPGGPICACFGVSAASVREDAELGRRERVRALIQRSASAEASCQECSPSGRSCETEVRRVFLRFLTGL